MLLRSNHRQLDLFRWNAKVYPWRHLGRLKAFLTIEQKLRYERNPTGLQMNPIHRTYWLSKMSM